MYRRGEKSRERDMRESLFCSGGVERESAWLGFVP